MSKLGMGVSIIDETDEQSVVDMVESSLLDRKMFSSVYILPPSLDQLRKRLHVRGDLSDEEILKRQEHAEERLELFERTKDYYDLVVVNDTLPQALKEIKDFILSK